MVKLTQLTLKSLTTDNALIACGSQRVLMTSMNLAFKMTI